MTAREKLLSEALCKLLQWHGVIRPNAGPTGPELLAIVDDVTSQDPPPYTPQLWRTIITGSYAYGTPTPDSDLDIVVCMGSDDLELLRKHADDASDLKRAHPSDFDGALSSGSFRFGKLNVIACVDPALFDTWWFGTHFLKTKAPVTRDQAVRYLQKKRKELKEIK